MLRTIVFSQWISLHIVSVHHKQTNKQTDKHLNMPRFHTYREGQTIFNAVLKMQHVDYTAQTVKILQSYSQG